jgi:hypothetical protein
MTPVFKWFVLFPFVVCMSLFIGCELAKADTLYVWQHSKHFPPVGKNIVRENHPLLIYENDKGWMAGYWLNSYDKDSYAVGYHHYMWKTSNKGEPDMSFGFKVGLVTGYNSPIFGTINAQIGYLDFNFVPTEVMSVGLKFDW